MGMLSGQSTGYNPTLSHGQYNGVVDVRGTPVYVNNGIAVSEGQQFIVSDDGKMVLNSQGKIVGSIQDGKFSVITEDYARKLNDSLRK